MCRGSRSVSVVRSTGFLFFQRSFLRGTGLGGAIKGYGCEGLPSSHMRLDGLVGNVGC